MSSVSQARTLFGMRLNPVDYEALVVSNAAVGPTPAKLTNRIVAVSVLIEAPGAPLNYLVHGGTPTAVLGKPVFDGKEMILNDLEASKFLVIRTGGLDGKAHLTYYERF